MTGIIRFLAGVVRASLACLGAGLLAVSAGCDRPAPAAANAPVEVRVGYFANVTHAQAVLEVSSGDLARSLAPATLSTRVFNAGPELIAALNAGVIDVGYVGPGPVIAAYSMSSGRSVRVVSGAAANGVVIVARAGSGIHSIADLAGHIVATPQQGNTQDVAARHFVKALAGGSTDSILPVPNSEQAGLMARGKIDAAWVPEPWGSRLVEQTGATVIAEEKDLWPSHQFALTVVITTPEFLAAHRPELDKLLAVHHTWTARLRKDPLQYVRPLGDALAQLTKVKLSDAVLSGSLKRTEFTDDPMPATFQTMAQWAHEAGFVREVPPLETLFVPVTPGAPGDQATAIDPAADAGAAKRGG